MSIPNDLAAVCAMDSRYPFQAYVFVIKALEHAKDLDGRPKGRERRKGEDPARHVTGRALCEGFRALAVKDYGMMALPALATMGISSTSDVGNLVYNLIESGDFDQSPADSRSDFEAVYDFADAFRLDAWAVPSEGA